MNNMICYSCRYKCLCCKYVNEVIEYKCDYCDVEHPMFELNTDYIKQCPQKINKIEVDKMSKYKILQDHLIDAIKEHDEITKIVLRSAIDNIQKTAIAKKCKDNITDELVNEVLIKEKKTLEEQINTCPKDRLEKIEQFNAQMEELKKYVPQLLDDPEEIREIIRQALAAAGIEPVKANRGAIMKLVVPIVKGKADMKVVNQVISEILI